MVLLPLALMLIMTIIIAKACSSFNIATSYLGRNMSPGIKGATLNAIGSSMPEFLTTVFFYFSKSLNKNTAIDLVIVYSIFIIYSIGAAQYYSGSDTFLSEMSGNFIEFFENGLGDTLRRISNYIFK